MSWHLCSIDKQLGSVRIICHSEEEHSLSQVTSQKFEDPADGEEMVKGKLAALTKEIKEAFRTLEESVR